MKGFGHVHIAVDGNLTNDILFAIVDRMIALFEPGLAHLASTKPVQLPMVCKKPSASTTGKGAVPSLASGGITKKLPYNTLHYMRKHVFWLICGHERANSCPNRTLDGQMGNDHGPTWDCKPSGGAGRLVTTAAGGRGGNLDHFF